MSELILSRQLGSLAGVFERHAPGGLHWDSLSAGQFAAAMRIYADVARRLEAELDRLRWAHSAARDAERNAPDVMQRALAEVERIITAPPPPDKPARRDRAQDELILAGLREGRVTLFPIVHRPAFDDGHVGAVGDDLTNQGDTA